MEMPVHDLRSFSIASPRANEEGRVVDGLTLSHQNPLRDNHTITNTGGKNMTTKTGGPIERMSELLESLGGIPPERVLLRPVPGTATEEDLIAHVERTGRSCELIDGILVEKPMGFGECLVGAEILRLVGNHLAATNLGAVVGEAAAMRLMPGLVRAPDVSFIRWEKLPGRKAPRKPVPDLVPDLAVEVLSKSNSKGEMTRKLREYFFHGVRLAWLVDPVKRTVRVCTPDGNETTLTEADSLEGGDVLPGLIIPIAPLFATVPDGPAPRKRRRRSDK